MSREFGFDAAKEETLVLGKDGVMSNVYVAVTSGLSDRKFAPADQPAIMNQVGLHYSPRVLGVRTKQILEFWNRDPVMHNAHDVSKLTPPLG